MLISEASEKYGLSADTLRYYERIGLIPPVHRNEGGIRDYTEQDCRWVEFIKCMRSAGLSIQALIEYVGLFQRGSETAEQRKQLLIDQRKEIVAKIEELEAAVDLLDHKIERYDDVILPKEAGLVTLALSDSR